MVDTEDNIPEPRGDGSTHYLPSGAVLAISLELPKEGAEHRHATGNKLAAPFEETRPELSTALDAAVARIAEQKIHLFDSAGKRVAELRLRRRSPGG